MFLMSGLFQVLNLFWGAEWLILRSSMFYQCNYRKFAVSGASCFKPLFYYMLAALKIFAQGISGTA